MGKKDELDIATFGDGAKLTRADFERNLSSLSHAYGF